MSRTVTVVDLSKISLPKLKQLQAFFVKAQLQGGGYQKMLNEVNAAIDAHPDKK